MELVAHKVAPALAVGAPIVLKPAPATPRSALLLADLLAETDLPQGAWAVLTMSNEETAALVKDPRLPVVSFTGSVPVGWSIRDAVPRKHVVLELGGNAAVVVCEDAPDLDWAASRVATFAMYQGGQSCVSVQRVLVAESIYEDFRDRVLKQVANLSVVDDVGPLINEDAAIRVESWVIEAVEAGAHLLCGGGRSGTTFEPTVLEAVAAGRRSSRRRCSGP